MSEQQHIVRRQVLEFRIGESAESFALQQEMARIYNEEIVPLLDEYLSTYSSPEAIDKIERLELDLGVLDRNDLRGSFVRKAAEQLAEQLPEIIGALERRRFDDLLVQQAAATATATAVSQTGNTEQHGPSAVGPGRSEEDVRQRFAAANQPYGLEVPPVNDENSRMRDVRESDAELVGFYLQTGRFPWWAREVGYEVLERTVIRLLEKQVALLYALLAKLLRQPAAARRLILSFGDELLVQITRQYLPETPAKAVPKLYATWKKLSTVRLNPGESRTTWWQPLLEHVFSVRKAGEIPAVLLERISAETPFPTAKKLSALENCIAVFGVRRPLENLGAAQLAVKVLNKRQTKRGTGDPADTADQQREADRAVALLVLELMSPVPEQGSSAEDRPAGRQPASSAKGADRGSGDRNPDRPRAAYPDPAATEKLYSAFSESDRLYVNDAGLVLLSVFLPHYFEKAGLLDENRQWTDDTCRAKAGVLLWFLVTGRAEPPIEAELVLIKIFCGIPEHEPVDTHYRPTKKEQRQANRLLLAAIQNWPKVGESSPDALRGNFIIRPGIVSERDGHWLVQVEKRPYDVLLKELPWSFSMIKFPWNPFIIAVEWPY